MENTSKTQVTVACEVQALVEKAWAVFTEPEHITQWNFAADSWQCPKAENDLREGGKFSYRMEAKDGSFGFDFEGQYEAVEPMKTIAYVLGDGRKATIAFEATPEGTTRVVETFDAEEVNSLEMQRGGWQAILDNYKKRAETL